jgi:pimeloyl-ACP methyl ester carboxylesterase
MQQQDYGGIGDPGHDWGARAAYTLAALFPARVTSIASIALAFQPRAKFHIPPFSQARH